MRFPIVIQGDWMQLIWHEADTREQALVEAATGWVNWSNNEGSRLCRLDPECPTGSYTPNLSIIVQARELILNPALEGRKWSPDLGIPLQIEGDWKTESVWTIPDYDKEEVSEEGN